MIKRMLSKALLSVFLEKDARDRVMGPDEVPKPGADDPLPSRLIKPPSAPEPEVPLRELSKQASNALSKAQADLDAPAPKALVRAAEQGPGSRPSKKAVIAAKQQAQHAEELGQAEPATDRQALIAQALAVQQKQAKKLDDLPPEDKLKLHLLARMALLGEDISNK